MKNKYSIIHCLLITFLLAGGLKAAAQQQQSAQTIVVDKMVATVNGDELITYTDLLWQMSLQPDTPLDSLAHPRSEELQRALQTIIDQIIILDEAEKLPTITPTDQEVRDELAATIKRFPSQEAFYQRLGRVGLSSEQLTDIIRRRVSINKYLDFRFRDFTVITDAEVQAYYKDVEMPRYRQQFPGQVVPPLEKLDQTIRQTLQEDKIASEMGSFLDDARQRAEIIYLSSV